MDYGHVPAVTVPAKYEQNGAAGSSFPTAGRVVCFSRWLTSTSRCFCGILPVLIGSSFQVSRSLELGFLLFSLQASWSEFYNQSWLPAPSTNRHGVLVLISWGLPSNQRFTTSRHVNQSWANSDDIMGTTGGQQRYGNTASMSSDYFGVGYSNDRGSAARDPHGIKQITVGPPHGIKQITMFIRENVECLDSSFTTTTTIKRHAVPAVKSMTVSDFRRRAEGEMKLNSIFAFKQPIS
ncbi:hypothetical protein J6590_049864 [Homalodisca vitripennis]|nr:hypothetical protein J6590_049864 [Homalodisca vitripennis]